MVSYVTHVNGWVLPAVYVSYMIQKFRLFMYPLTFIICSCKQVIDQRAVDAYLG